ncbi:MAG TPA: DUF6599 family protein [Acidobacteriaceae bacterium]|jgi:hypothetical protein|nr:DUF6599 family protein [Acidobacteriaceae bacterium]
MPRLLACAFLISGSMAFAAPAAQPAPLMPQSFGGWTIRLAKDAPPGPTPDEAAILQEDGLSTQASALYDNGSGEVLVHAWQFKDATGAYGAFTYYRQPGMHPVDLGKGGAATGDHFVFWTGATVVDATFMRHAPDETAALTALAATLPQVHGAEGVAPSLPHYLPSTDLDAGSTHYSIGPAAYAATGGAFPASVLHFDQDEEALTAQYGPAGAQATLTLVMYPTPQMAEAHLNAMQSAAQRGHGIGLAKRSGPLLAVVSGNFPAQKAQTLLDSIHFDDTVTINHPEGYVSEGAKLYRLLYGITVLTMVLAGAAVLLGVFLGGGRAMLRILRGKSASTLSEEEFISLHLGG